jgi:hypothetical protein
LTSTQCLQWAAEHQHDELFITSGLRKLNNEKRDGSDVCGPKLRATMDESRSLPHSYSVAILALSAGRFGGFGSVWMGQDKAYKHFMWLVNQYDK